MDTATPKNVQPSPLIQRAAWRLNLLEKLSTICSGAWDDSETRHDFWSFVRLAASESPDGPAWLPALTAAILNWKDTCDIPPVVDILCALRGEFPPETRDWLPSLMDALAPYLQTQDPNLRIVLLRALVFLDSRGCSFGDSGLARWVSEARYALALREKPTYLERTWHRDWRLSVLAGWSPRPEVVYPSELLSEWIAIWNQLRISCQPWPLRMAAIQALLNLGEAGLLPAQITPDRLLSDMADQTTADIPLYDQFLWDIPWLTLWQPTAATSFSTPALKRVVEAWIKCIQKGHGDWCLQYQVWQALMNWNRHGIPARCGIDLLPLLMDRLPHEKALSIVEFMARWRPAPGAPAPAPSLLQQFADLWWKLYQDTYPRKRAKALLATVHLLSIPGLPMETVELLEQRCLTAIQEETEPSALFPLAHWMEMVPLDRHPHWLQAWGSRLGDAQEEIRLAATLAVWSLWENQWTQSASTGYTGQRRRLRQLVRRTWHALQSHSSPVGNNWLPHPRRIFPLLAALAAEPGRPSRPLVYVHVPVLFPRKLSTLPEKFLRQERSIGSAT